MPGSLRAPWQGRAVPSGATLRKTRPPAVHARLGTLRIVVGNDVEDAHAIAVRLLVPVRDRLRTFELLAGGEELVPVVERPAVELGVGQLDVVRLQVQRHVEDGIGAVDVVPVKHDVEDHRIALRLDRSRHLDLVGEGVRAGEAVVELRVARLEADLDVVEARFPETCHASRIHADRGCDEIGVVAEAARLRDQVLEIAAHERLAAGEPELRRAETPRLAKRVDPLLRGQLAPGAGEIEGIRAVGALQRTRVGELREQPQRPGRILGQGTVPGAVSGRCSPIGGERLHRTGGGGARGAGRIPSRPKGHRQSQRLPMYIVISKPKRISVKSGLVHMVLTSGTMIGLRIIPASKAPVRLSNATYVPFQARGSRSEGSFLKSNTCNGGRCRDPRLRGESSAR